VTAWHGSGPIPFGKKIESPRDGTASLNAIIMHVLLFTQPGCFSCELMRIYLEARDIAFEERDISADPEARRTMTETYDSDETPTLVIDGEAVIGFDPALLDQLIDPAPSSDSVPEN
jgi:glutaredoxin